MVTSSMPAPPRFFLTFSQASSQFFRLNTLSISEWTFFVPCLPSDACGFCGSTVSSVPALGLSHLELSNLPVPTHRFPHVSLAQQSTGPSPSARPFASGGAAAPGSGPRPFAVASFLSNMPRSDSWHRVGRNFARADSRAYRSVASGRGLCSPLPALSSAGVPRFRPSRPFGRYQVALGHPRLFPTVSSAHTVVRWGGTMRLRLHSAGSTIPHLGPTGSSWGCLPSITTRWFSASPSDPTSRWAPCPPESCERVASGPPWLCPAFAFVPG